MNMQETFNREYEAILQNKFDAKYNKKVEASAKVIIQANMQQGDTLKGKALNGEPIVFSEWQDVGGNPGKVQRTEYTFESILNQGEATGTVKNSYEQLDLFAPIESDQEVEHSVSYAPCKWTDIYLKEIEVN